MEIVGSWECGDHLYTLSRLPLGESALLSRREREVVQCAVLGLSNREIARRLGIATHTVSAHLRKIFRKLDISSRLELYVHHVHAVARAIASNARGSDAERD